MTRNKELIELHHVYQILSMIIAPTLFWGAYILYKDRFKPEPMSRLALSYLLGFGSVYLALGLYEIIEISLPSVDPLAMMVHDRPGFFLYSILAIGPVEELSKLIPFILICTRFRQFDEKMDGIVYASMIGLGFASIENLRLSEALSGYELYAHAIAAPIVHMTFASIWGVAYSSARLRRKRTWPTAVLAFVASAIAHGGYDFLATDAQWGFSSAGVILVLWVSGILVMNRFQKQQMADTGMSSTPNGDQ